MNYLVLKFPNVGSVFLATALAVGPIVVLVRMLRTGDVATIWRAFRFAGPGGPRPIWARHGDRDHPRARVRHGGQAVDRLSGRRIDRDRLRPPGIAVGIRPVFRYTLVDPAVRIMAAWRTP